MIFSKTLVYNDLKSLLNSLNNNELESKSNFLIYNKYVVGIKNDTNNYLRIWKSKAIKNYYFNDMKAFHNLICCLDYKINNDHIKIEYLSINNLIYNKDLILNDDDATKLKIALIKYIEKIAKKNNLDKIIINKDTSKKFYDNNGEDILLHIYEDYLYTTNREKIIDIKDNIFKKIIFF
jgi:hypothetical protein